MPESGSQRSWIEKKTVMAECHGAVRAENDRAVMTQEWRPLPRRGDWFGLQDAQDAAI